MTVDQIIKLLDAGYTKEELNKLDAMERGAADGQKQDQSNDEDQTSHQDQSNDKDQPESEPDTGNQNKPEDNAGAAIETRIAGVEKRIDEMIRAIQKANLKNDSFESNQESLESETDKIMQSIIRPELKKGGSGND